MSELRSESLWLKHLDEARKSMVLISVYAPPYKALPIVLGVIVGKGVSPIKLLLG